MNRKPYDYEQDVPMPMRGVWIGLLLVAPIWTVVGWAVYQAVTP